MPQTETREIPDSELDHVSGGILGADLVTGGAESALPGLPALGGSVSGGLSAQAGPVAGQAGFSGGLGV
ncbi:type A2 lantipeptide [Streptomyces sp. NPDC002055]|uniref:type A2 lantipeptide n=1 Tax=Streptomyces sp. NPDC002055 TaxID=3154534 RepID=UPI003323AAA9